MRAFILKVKYKDVERSVAIILYETYTLNRQNL